MKKPHGGCLWSGQLWLPLLSVRTIEKVLQNFPPERIRGQGIYPPTSLLFWPRLAPSAHFQFALCVGRVSSQSYQESPGAEVEVECCPPAWELTP